MEEISKIVKQQNPLCNDITLSIKTIQTALSNIDLKNKAIEKIYEQYNVYEVKDRLYHCLSEIQALKSSLNNVRKENEFLHKKITNTTKKHNIMQMLIQINNNINSIKDNITIKQKEIKSEETQTDFLKDDAQQQINLPCSKIEGIQHHMNLNDIHNSSPYSLIELSDKRIASGGGDGSLSICSINLITKEWKQDIKKEKAHDNIIRSICELDQNRLISGSLDTSIKIWKILQNDLSLIQTLKSHSRTIAHVIPLSQQRFASSSHDNKIKIWDSETYKEIKTLNLEGCANSMIKLKNKEILVSTCYSPDYIEFWNLNNYQKQHSIKGYVAVFQNQLIELQNGYIALVFYTSGKTIVIIDPENYSVVKEIKDQEYITNYSSLCCWGNNSFIYVYDGKMLQIKIDDYSVIFKTNKENQLFGHHCMITMKNGNYLIIENKSNGFIIVKPN